MHDACMVRLVPKANN